MKFKLIPILVLSILLIPFVANGKECTHKLNNPLYFYDFANWKKHPDLTNCVDWEDMQNISFSNETINCECREIATSNYTFITNVINLCSPEYVFSVKDLEKVCLRDHDLKEDEKVLDLVIEDSSLNLCTTNLLCSYEHPTTGTIITQLYYYVIISNITFNVLSPREESSSTKEIYAFNIPSDIKLVNLNDNDNTDFTTLTNLYPDENFRRAKEPFTFTNPSSYHITNGLSVYVNGEVVGKVTNNNQIAWNDTLLEKYDEYIEIKEISFLPFSSVTNVWDSNPNKGPVRESISNFVANASNINRDFYNSVTDYLNKVLPEVSITNECNQLVRVQIGVPAKKPLTQFDLEKDTKTSIVNQTLLNALFDEKSTSVQIKYWVTNGCSDCITEKVVGPTFNKYNSKDYVIKLNIPLQDYVSYVSLTNIPENAKVEFNRNVKKLSPTNGIITISTTPHTTNGTFNVTQLYYKSTNIIFTSGCINSTNYIAYPELEPLDWQSCSITNTSKYPCDIKISYSSIIIDAFTIEPNSSTNYCLKSQSVDPIVNPIDVIFSWNTNTITNTFTRVKDSENNSITIKVQGMDPVSAFVGKTLKPDIIMFCINVNKVADNKLNTENSKNLFHAFKTGIFKDYTNLVDVINIITEAEYETGEKCFYKLTETVNGQTQIMPKCLTAITNAFNEAHPEQEGK